MKSVTQQENIEQNVKKKKHPVRMFLIVVLGLILGCAVYVFWMFGGTYTSVDVVTEEEYNNLGELEDDAISGSDLAAWEDGGHTPVYYNPNHPIIKVEQKDKYVENILVFAVDARSEADYKCRSDAMIVVSINKRDKSIKLMSIMRDSGVYIGDTDSTASTTLDKINAAYRYGGVGMMINTINRNFDLDIQRFVMFDFSSAADVIDLVGGVDIEVSAEEIPYANGFIEEDNALNGTDSPLITEAGLQTLDGIQAVSWARIRYLDSDFVRTARQRTIAQAIMQKVKGMNVIEQLRLFHNSAGMFETNMITLDLFRVALSAIGYTDNIVESRVPSDGLYTVQSNPWMMIIDFEAQNQVIRDFIWGEYNE